MGTNADRKVAGNMVFLKNEYWLKEMPMDLYKSIIFLSTLLYEVSVEYIRQNIDFFDLYQMQHTQCSFLLFSPQTCEMGWLSVCDWSKVT